jgi:dihydrofolate reductase
MTSALRGVPSTEDATSKLVRGDDHLENAVRQLKRQPGWGLFVGGVKLPMALAELGLIDEYEFVVHPRLAGHGQMPFAGLSKPLDLKLVSRLEFGSGAVAMRYEPRPQRAGWLARGGHCKTARYSSHTRWSGVVPQTTE